MNRRHFFAALAALTFGAAPLAAQAAPLKVNIGYVPNSDFLPAYIAKDKGFFEKHGIDATLTKVALSSLVPPSLVSQSLDIGMGTPSGFIQTAIGGLDLVVVAGASRFEKSHPVTSLMVRPAANIKTPADLKGKRLGSAGYLSIIDIVLRKWLIVNGVQPKEVTIVEVPFPQMRDLLANRTIDAATPIEPFVGRITGDGTAVKFADYYYEVANNASGAFWMATRKWVDAHPEAVPAFRAALQEGIDFIKSNESEANAVELKYLGFNAPVKPFYSLEVTPKDLDFYAAILKEIGELPQPVDTTKLIVK
jgi:NitT/TauT family transport system substrate-binding protein